MTRYIYIYIYIYIYKRQTLTSPFSVSCATLRKPRRNEALPSPPRPPNAQMYLYPISPATLIGLYLNCTQHMICDRTGRPLLLAVRSDVRNHLDVFSLIVERVGLGLGLGLGP
jgi:hypothetical protein